MYAAIISDYEDSGAFYTEEMQLLSNFKGVFVISQQQLATLKIQETVHYFNKHKIDKFEQIYEFSM